MFNATYLSWRMIHILFWMLGNGCIYVWTCSFTAPLRTFQLTNHTICLIPPWEVFNAVKHLTVYCLVPQISAGPSHENITSKIKLNVGKTRSVTKVDATPPMTMTMTGKGTAPLTHSLFGRYSASLSFPLVSPEKRERVPICLVQWQEVHGENGVKAYTAWTRGVRSYQGARPLSRPPAYNHVGRSHKRTKAQSGH